MEGSGEAADRGSPQPAARMRVMASETAPPTPAPAALVVLQDTLLHRPRPAWRDRIGLVAAAVVACAVHASVLAMLGRPPSDLAGAGGIDLEAVSMEVAIVPSVALPATVAAGVPQPGSEALLADAAMPSPTRRPPSAVTDEPVVATSDAVATIARTDPAEPSPDTVEVVADEAPVPPVADASSVAATSAASASAAAATSGAGGGSEAASPGQARAYARSVVEALGRSRPKRAPGGGKGTVRVIFAIGATGGLDFVRIARSSGQPSLDEAAVTTVQKAQFEPPPQGLARTDRTYEVPFYFR